MAKRAKDKVPKYIGKLYEALENNLLDDVKWDRTGKRVEFLEDYNHSEFKRKTGTAWGNVDRQMSTFCFKRIAKDSEKDKKAKKGKKDKKAKKDEKDTKENADKRVFENVFFQKGQKELLKQIKRNEQAANSEKSDVSLANNSVHSEEEEAPEQLLGMPPATKRLQRNLVSEEQNNPIAQGHHQHNQIFSNYIRNTALEGQMQISYIKDGKTDSKIIEDCYKQKIDKLEFEKETFLEKCLTLKQQNRTLQQQNHTLKQQNDTLEEALKAKDQLIVGLQYALRQRELEVHNWRLSAGNFSTQLPTNNSDLSKRSDENQVEIIEPYSHKTKAQEYKIPNNEGCVPIAQKQKNYDLEDNKSKNPEFVSNFNLSDPPELLASRSYNSQASFELDFLRKKNLKNYQPHPHPYENADDQDIEYYKRQPESPTDFLNN